MSKLEELTLGIGLGFFGESVTFTQSGVGTPINAVFEMQWIESNGVSTHSLTAIVKAADLPAEPGKGATITRNSKVYKVSVSQADGVGGYTLILSE